MLIGRRKERAALDALVEAAARGRGAALLVTGEPGIGKTTLLDDLATRAHEGRRCSARRAASPTWICPSLGSRSSCDLPSPASRGFRHPGRRTLRRALDLEAGGSVGDGLAVGVATLGLLELLAEDTPVLVVVDDLQWVDEPTRATILFLARRIGSLEVALVCGARDGELSEPELRGLPRLALGPLATREASELLAASSRVPLDRAVRRRILEVSEGNPLALAELPVGLSDAQLAGHEPLGDPIPVNGGIERAFRARVARLPERTRRALLIVAAAGSDDTESSMVAALQAEGLGLHDLEPGAGRPARDGHGEGCVVPASDGSVRRLPR